LLEVGVAAGVLAADVLALLAGALAVLVGLGEALLPEVAACAGSLAWPAAMLTAAGWVST
jgi:hypothetical protein